MPVDGVPAGAVWTLRGAGKAPTAVKGAAEIALIEKIGEELEELAEAARAGDEAAMADELGDLLFAVVNLARHLGVDAEQALTAANRKFERRFRRMEQDVLAAGEAFRDMDIEALEVRWQAAKRALGRQG